MCNFKSMVLDYNLHVYWDKHDDHTKLIEDKKLKDLTYDKDDMKFARVEVNSKDGNDLNLDKDNWEVIVDENRKPSWWNEACNKICLEMFWKECVPFHYKDGVFTAYDKNGNKDYEWKYKNGKLNGQAIKYYENGKKEYECMWKDGEKNGKEIVYYENGNKECECIYEDGILINYIDK